jgi:hypothetical protein
MNTRFTLLATGVAAGLFFGILLFLELGRWLGRRQVAKHGTDARTGVGVVDGAVFSLFGLLIGFSFSGAASRFDQRRDLVAQEVNAIGTAWQRIDALPDTSQVAIRDGFRRYMDALIRSYTAPPNRVTDALHEPAPLAGAEQDIWSRSMAASLTPEGEKARMLLLPSLNEMFGAVERERMARRMHPPPLIFIMLGITALAGAMFAGYGMAGGAARNWIYILGFATTVSLAAYVIIELEFPRLGMVRVEAFDQALVDLRATMR